MEFDDGESQDDEQDLKSINFSNNSFIMGIEDEN